MVARDGSDRRARDNGPARPSPPTELEAAAEALALAFADDPCWAHLLPDDETRAEKLLAYFTSEIETLVPSYREVWVTEDGGGAAIWAPPGRWRVPLGLTLREARPDARSVRPPPAARPARPAPPREPPPEVARTTGTCTTSGSNRVARAAASAAR